MDTNIILRVPDAVTQDTMDFRSEADKFLDNLIEPDVFKAYRVPMGIYEQRTSGKYMVRIRIGAGIVTPGQLKKTAQLSKKYANGIVHLTTRQDLQLHGVNIEDTPDILEQLLDVGLSTKGGGGNTVRNVTACPRSGVCPNEIFDVAPYSIAVAEYLLANKDSFALPRKYKISFSGCASDCALASVSDLGFFAKLVDGQKGFAVYAAGGLGKKSRVAVKIEDFITEDKIFVVAEAIRRLFYKYGDRENRNKARLRFVLERFGQDKFVELYKQEKEELISENNNNFPKIRNVSYENSEQVSDKQHIDKNSNCLLDKQKGFATIKLNLNQGDIPADDLVKVAEIAEKHSKGFVRTSQIQNLCMTSIPLNDIKAVEKELARLSINVSGKIKNNIVTCTGASTCRLGFCFSRNLADAISEKLRDNNIINTDKLLRISGCPNSCGHHFIANIGLQGRAKKIDGKLMPHYDIFFGGQTIQDSARLAEKIGILPAKAIPAFVLQLYKSDVIDKNSTLEAIEIISNSLPKILPDDFYCDFGSDKPFSVNIA